MNSSNDSNNDSSSNNDKDDNNNNITMVILPEINDVLLGRGGRTNHHVGNVRYRKLVASLQAVYNLPTTTLKEKTAMSWKVVDDVLSRGCRFLKFDPNTKLWVQVGRKKAREKVAQALREVPPDRRTCQGQAKVLTRILEHNKNDMNKDGTPSSSCTTLLGCGNVNVNVTADVPEVQKRKVQEEVLRLRLEHTTQLMQQLEQQMQQEQFKLEQQKLLWRQQIIVKHEFLKLMQQDRLQLMQQQWEQERLQQLQQLMQPESQKQLRKQNQKQMQQEMQQQLEQQMEQPAPQSQQEMQQQLEQARQLEQQWLEFLTLIQEKDDGSNSNKNSK